MELNTVVAVLLAVFQGTVFQGSAQPNLKSFDSGCKALAYQEYGSEGSPIILLAGGPGMNPVYMAPVAKVLASGNRRVVLFHQRGTGKSGDAISCRERMNLAGAVADLEALRVNLHLEKLTIAGHSWGGMLAMAYAQEHPDRVAGLLLLDSGPMNESGFKTESANVQARLSSEDRAALKNAKSEEEIDAIEEKAYFADSANVSRLRESIPAGEPLWYESVGESMGPGLAGFDVVRGMRNLKAPVTLVFGRRDPGFFVAQEIQDLQPSSKLFVIEQAGHYPWLENAAETAKVLKAAAAVMP
jgi:proline iminopeptidase